MENLLLHYMIRRFETEPQKKRSLQEAGPIITISRESGCHGNEIAILLAQKLNQSGIFKRKWTTINKEIMEDSARELNIHTDRMNTVLKHYERSMIHEILASMSRYYKTDWELKRTIRGVVHSVAGDGYAIIVGRGGAAITCSVEKALHIRLEAPVNWRANQISHKHNISLDEAREYIKTVDRKRTYFRENFICSSRKSVMFDATFNCMTLSQEDIVDGIINLLKTKNILH